MRIAVMAAGAVGGYFGARLAAAGYEVAFIARVEAGRTTFFADGVRSPDDRIAGQIMENASL